MKTKNIQQLLDELTRGHIGIVSMQDDETHVLTTFQIKKAIKESFLLGEKLGYEIGMLNAKSVCELNGNCYGQELKTILDIKGVKE